MLEALCLIAVCALPVTFLIVHDRRKRRREQSHRIALQSHIQDCRYHLDRLYEATNDRRVRACVKFGAASLDLARTAFEMDVLYRARAHWRWAMYTLQWARVLHGDRAADTTDGAATNRLLLALLLLRKAKYEAAAEEFEVLWLDNDVDVRIKQAGLRAHAEGLRQRGYPPEAVGDYERMADALPELMKVGRVTFLADRPQVK